jgi:hypothetical protein
MGLLRRVLRPRAALAVAISFAVFALASRPASAELELSFVNITNNSGVNVAPQLKVTVYSSTDSQSLVPGFAASKVLFVFENGIGIGSSITDVYFDDGALFGIASLHSSTGVDFSIGASPGNLPGGDSLTPQFQATSPLFTADSNSPMTSAKGVNSATEWLGVLFDLKAGKSYDDVIAALSIPTDTVNGLRIGMHVQAIAGAGANDSDGFVNVVSAPEPTVVSAPEPSTILGALIAGVPLGLVALRRRRRG